jgi:hypothetical protein
LRLGFEAAKGAGVNDPVAVALKVIAIGMLGLRNSASAGFFDPHGVIGQHNGSLTLSKKRIHHGRRREHGEVQGLFFPGHAIHHSGRVVADVQRAVTAHD